MRYRTALATTTLAFAGIGLMAAPANADHTKGKKYLDIELTVEAAEAADDGFGVAPEGTLGEGAFYLNHGQNRFCAFLDFTLNEGDSIVAMHVHEKDRDSDNPETGGVAIDLGSLLNEDGTASSGCLTADRAELRGVLSEADEYYVNAHTSDNLTVVRFEFGDF